MENQLLRDVLQQKSCPVMNFSLKNTYKVVLFQFLGSQPATLLKSNSQIKMDQETFPQFSEQLFQKHQLSDCFYIEQDQHKH